MTELKKFTTLLNDEEFGKLCKCYFHYMDNRVLPENIDDKSEQLFNIIKKEIDKKIKDKERKYEKRMEEKLNARG